MSPAVMDVRHVILPLLLLLTVAPFASAERACTPGDFTLFVACAEHTPEGVGRCDGTLEDYYTTRVDLFPQFFWIGAGVEWLCERTPERSGEASVAFVSVYSPELVEAGMRWESVRVQTEEGTYRHCFLVVFAEGRALELACPADQGPPNPSTIP